MTLSQLIGDLRKAIHDTPNGLVSVAVQMAYGEVVGHVVKTEDAEVPVLMRQVPCKREAEADVRRGRRR